MPFHRYLKPFFIIQTVRDSSMMRHGQYVAHVMAQSDSNVLISCYEPLQAYTYQEFSVRDRPSHASVHRDGGAREDAYDADGVLTGTAAAVPGSGGWAPRS